MKEDYCIDYEKSRIKYPKRKHLYDEEEMED